MFLSSPNVWCLQIRVKESHESWYKLKQLKLVHRNGKRWFWGASSRYGFHCFNCLQPSGRCPDFEYRLFSNCNF